MNDEIQKPKDSNPRLTPLDDMGLTGWGFRKRKSQALKNKTVYDIYTPKGWNISTYIEEDKTLHLHFPINDMIVVEESRFQSMHQAARFSYLQYIQHLTSLIF